MRENIYAVPPRTPLPRFIEMAIDSFLLGFPEAVKSALPRAE
jgi:hypothetical protein